MAFSDLIQEIKKTDPDEVRQETAEIFECVFGDSADEIKKALEAFFGPALKPEGENPTGALKGVTDQFGGIRKNQTLYYTEKDSVNYAAMIWPWSDGERATLKIFPTTIKIAKDNSQNPSGSSFLGNIKDFFGSK